jgi:hypothetical protein
MAHYISSKFASFETTHALVDRDTGKMIGEPVRAAVLLATGMPAGHPLALRCATSKLQKPIWRKWENGRSQQHAISTHIQCMHAGRQYISPCRTNLALQGKHQSMSCKTPQLLLDLGFPSPPRPL